MLDITEALPLLSSFSSKILYPKFPEYVPPLKIAPFSNCIQNLSLMQPPQDDLRNVTSSAQERNNERAAMVT